MSILSLFGLCAVTAAVLFYTLENFSSWFILAFAVANAMAGIYAFFQGAWPYALVEVVWTFVGLWRWASNRPGRLMELRTRNDERYVRNVIKRLVGGDRYSTRRSPAIVILEDRYIRGEINRNEFLQKLNDIFC
jgi:uncharacterized membrane protein